MYQDQANKDQCVLIKLPVVKRTIHDIIIEHSRF